MTDTPSENKREFSVLEGVAYLVGAIGVQFTTITIVQWFQYFYVPPADSGKTIYSTLKIISLAAGLGRFMDAISDPLIGFLSDRTRHRLGRRRPFILYGCIPLMFSFIALWFPPVQKLSIVNGIYGVIMVSVYWWLMTVVLIPYNALLPEMARTKEGRVALGIYNSAGLILGLFAAFMLSQFLIDKFNIQVMGVVLGIFSTLCLLFCGVVIKERFHEDTAAPPTQFVEEALLAMKNKPFLILMLAFFIFQLGFFSIQAMLPYYVDAVLHHKATDVVNFMLALMLTTVATFPIISILSKKIPIKTLYGGSLLLMGLFLPFLYVTGKMQGASAFYFSIAVAGLVGIPQAGLYVLQGPILGEVIDLDEQMTGRRREAIYTGVINFMMKLGWTFSTIVMWLLFDTFGYSRANPGGILLMGPAAGFICVVGFLIFTRYRIVKPDKSVAGADISHTRK